MYISITIKISMPTTT